MLTSVVIVSSGRFRSLPLREGVSLLLLDKYDQSLELKAGVAGLVAKLNECRNLVVLKSLCIAVQT